MLARPAADSEAPTALAGGHCAVCLELSNCATRGPQASRCGYLCGRASPLARYNNAGTRQRGSVAAPSLPAGSAFQDAGAPRHRARAGVANGTGHGDEQKEAEQSSMLGSKDQSEDGALERFTVSVAL